VSGMVPLGEATKSVSPRFNLVSLIPSALLVSGIGFLVLSGSFSGVPNTHLLVKRLEDINVFLGSVLLLAVLSFALVLQPFQLLLVRVLEGYWDQIPVLRSFRYFGVEINRRRHLKIHELTQDDDLLARLYPPRVEDFLPTRLGNVLRSAERRAGKNHGFTEPVEMFPRIYPYMSPPLAEALADARDDLDVACRMCIVLWLLASVSGAVLAVDGAVAATRGAALAVPVGGILLAVLAYRGAVRTGEEYGKLLFYVFDLHRRDLIRALGYSPPRNPKEEKELIKDITHWLVHDGPAPTRHRERPTQGSAGLPSS
jgi:hypothetical protein